jgi:hypothetical protein
MRVDSGIKKANQRFAGSPANKIFAETHSVLRNLAGLRLKETSYLIALVTERGLTIFAPLAAVLHNPVRQRALETDVTTGFFGLNPFVPQNLFAFSLKLAIQRRILQQIVA